MPQWLLLQQPLRLPGAASEGMLVATESPQGRRRCESWRRSSKATRQLSRPTDPQRSATSCMQWESESVRAKFSNLPALPKQRGLRKSIRACAHRMKWALFSRCWPSHQQPSLLAQLLVFHPGQRLRRLTAPRRRTSLVSLNWIRMHFLKVYQKSTTDCLQGHPSVLLTGGSWLKQLSRRISSRVRRNPAATVLALLGAVPGGSDDRMCTATC
mmetsp:Transcript_46472/g.116484  ORF Transcript_46472/g.116484 Transcript_46472/m.116484 type:complete len:213 (-) Transcript_46472:138-776(-)